MDQKNHTKSQKSIYNKIRKLNITTREQQQLTLKMKKKI